MTILPSRREFVVPRGLVGVRQAMHSLIATTAVASIAAAIATAETVWLLHVNAPRTCSAIETSVMVFAVISAVLLRFQFLHTRRLCDLLLLTGLAAVSLTQLVFRALPAFTNTISGSDGTGARLACSLLVAGALLAAAFAPPGRLIASDVRLASLPAFASIGVVVVGEVLDLIARPKGVSASPIYEPVVMTVAFVSFCGLLVAGFGFASRSGSEAGEGVLLSAASYLLAGVALQQLVLPLAPRGWLTPGEVFNFIAYLLLLAAAFRMYVRTRERGPHEAVNAERVRIARDLHDGLAQDLAFISAHGERLARELGESHPLTIAARRALAASRGAIVDLEASEASSTAAALRRVSTELQERFGVAIEVRTEGPEDPDIRLADRGELVRIAREAIVNAVRHGGAQNIEVTLGSRESDLLLRICDDGCGLGDPAAHATTGTGLGMRIMRGRARSLGGHLIARRRDVGGTEIGVAVPDRRTKPRA